MAMLVSGRVPGWRTVYDSGVTRCGVTADKAYKISSILPCKVCKLGVAVVSEFETVFQLNNTLAPVCAPANVARFGSF